MKIKSVKLLRAFDRDTGSALLINGVAVTSVNYDEDGSAGERVLESVHRCLADMAKVTAEEEEVDDDEYYRILGY